MQKETKIRLLIIFVSIIILFVSLYYFMNLAIGPENIALLYGLAILIFTGLNGIVYSKDISLYFCMPHNLRIPITFKDILIYNRPIAFYLCINFFMILPLSSFLLFRIIDESYHMIVHIFLDILLIILILYFVYIFLRLVLYITHKIDRKGSVVAYFKKSLDVYITKRKHKNLSSQILNKTLASSNTLLSKYLKKSLKKEYEKDLKRKRASFLLSITLCAFLIFLIFIHLKGALSSTSWIEFLFHIIMLIIFLWGIRILTSISKSIKDEMLAIDHKLKSL